jgi:ribosomal protein L39E
MIDGEKMADNKHLSRKLHLIKAIKKAVPAPYWAILKVFGKRRVGSRWKLNPHERRNWRRNRLKI